MTRRSLRRSLATVCAAAFAAGILGVAVGGPAGAQTATPPPPGGGVKVTVGDITVAGASTERAPIGPLSFT